VADAIVFLMNTFNPTKQQNEAGNIMFNIGTGIDITIKDLAELMKKIIGYEGKVAWDTSKPNGTPRKLMDVSKLHSI
jgi:GDP-L-fucose synthase